MRNKHLHVELEIDGNDREVFVNGNRLDPYHSQAVRNHSPDGFNWGYGGSGPAQTALAILLEAGVSKETALRLYQNFKWDFINRLPFNQDASFDVDLEDWLAIETRD